MLIHEVLIPIVGPAVFAGIFWILVWRPWRTAPAANFRPDPVQSASLALALGVGLFLGYLKLAGWPPLPPKMATQWLALLAIAWAVLGYGVAALDGKRSWRMAYVLVLAAITCALQSQALLKYAWSLPVAVLWVGLFAALAVGGSELLTHAARQRPGGSVPIALMMGAAGLFGSTLLSYSAFLGQLSGMLASMAGAAVVMSFISLRFSLAGPGVTVFYVLYLSLIGHGFFYSTVPALSAVLLIAAPLTVIVSTFPQGWPARSWKAFLLNLILSAVLSGGAVYAAYAVRAAKLAVGQDGALEY